MLSLEQHWVQRTKCELLRSSLGDCRWYRGSPLSGLLPFP